MSLGSVEPRTASDLVAGLEAIIASPSDSASLAMIVERPDVGQRNLPQSARLEPGKGLVDDNYLTRGSSRTPDGAAHPEAQVTIMNTRVLDLLTGGDRSQWPLAGDQLVVDLDLSFENLPPGTRLTVGSTELEISAKPHTGCKKFTERFGVEASRWLVGNPDLRLRGVNAMVTTAGACSVGDTMSKITV